MADTTLPGLLDTGTHAARPAAGDVGSGALYSCTDHGLIYQSDGSSWTTWATLGGGAVAAVDVSITDAGTYFTGTDVEAALQELGAAGGGTSDGWPTGYHPDRPPAAGTSLTDEFADSSLNGAWGWVAAGAPATVDESLYPGHLYLGSVGSPTTTHLRRTYAPGAVDFTVAAKCAFTSPDLTATGGMGIGISLLDSADAVIWTLYVIDGGQIGTQARMFSTATGLTAVTHGDGGVPIYLAIQRTSANVYTGYYSFNGINWGKHGSSTVATTVDRVGIRIENNATGTNDRSASVDFIRVMSSLTNKIGST